jgi:hypothetical protein
MIRSDGWSPAVNRSSGGKARRHTGDHALVTVALVDAFKRFTQNLGDRDKVLAHATAGDAEDELSAESTNISTSWSSRKPIPDLCTRGDHLAEHRFLDDQPSVILDVGRRGYGVEKRGHIGHAAHVIELPLAAQPLGDADQVGRFAALEELDNDLVDLPVSVAVEVLGTYQFDDARDGVPFEQHRA